MADTIPQLSDLSKLGIADQTTLGTYVAPTELVPTEEFQAPDDPQILEFRAEQGSRNTVIDTREGIHKVLPKIPVAFRANRAIFLLKKALGFSTLTGGSPVSLTLASATTVGATSVPFTSLPALATGISEYQGVMIDLGTTASNSYERVPVLDVTANTIKTLPLKFAHDPANPTANGLAVVPVQNVLQENVGSSIGDLGLVSICAQYARLYQRTYQDCMVSKFSLKGTTKEVKAEYDFGSMQKPSDPATSLTTIPLNSAAATDAPFILRDGGLISPFATTDTVPQMHNKLTTLDYELDNKLVAEEYGGGAQTAEHYLPGERDQKITFSEDAGQNNATPDIWANYVNSQSKMAAYLFLLNPNTNHAISMWFPQCKVRKYDTRSARGKAVGYDGELVPEESSTFGKSVKMSVVNASTALM